MVSMFVPKGAAHVRVPPETGLLAGATEVEAAVLAPADAVVGLAGAVVGVTGAVGAQAANRPPAADAPAPSTTSLINERRDCTLRVC